VVLVRVGDDMLAVDGTCIHCEVPLACGALTGTRPASAFGSAKRSSVRDVPAMSTGAADLGQDAMRGRPVAVATTMASTKLRSPSIVATLMSRAISIRA